VKEDAVLVDRDDPYHFGPPALAIDMAAALVTVALLAAVGFGGPAPIRTLLALAFVTFVPGWAVFGPSRLVDGTSKLALAVAASLTACTATATTMAWLRLWHPLALFYALAGVSLVPLVWRTAHRAARPAPQPVGGEPVDEAPTPMLAAPAPLPPVRGSRPIQPQSTGPDPEQLPLTALTVRVTFLARAPFAVHELSDFFAAVQAGHPFTDFHRGPDGAVMETPGSRRLEIRPGWIDYQETAPFDFQHARWRTVDLLGQVQERLGVQYLANPTFRLQAQVAAPAHFAAASVDHGTVAVLSSTTPVAVGLRLAGTSDAPRYTWQVLVAPDARQGGLTVDLITDFPVPTAGPGAVGQHLQQSHHFLTGNVVRFVESLRAASRD
jgi:hypothetical protein